MFTFFPLYLFFLEKIYVFIKISHCSSSENRSLAHIRKPSRWLWSLATFLIIWNAPPEPAVNPLRGTGGDGICWGGEEEEEEGEVVRHCSDPERRNPSPRPLSWAGQQEHVATGGATSCLTVGLRAGRAAGHRGCRGHPAARLAPPNSCMFA